MTKVEIGIGALLAAVAGLGWATDKAMNYFVLALGVMLVLQGGYEAYLKPNFYLDKTLVRWLNRRAWRVTVERTPEFLIVPNNKMYFVLGATDEANRTVVITRDKATKFLLAFSGRLELDADTIRSLSDYLTPVDHRIIYEDLHQLFTSMHLAYNTQRMAHIVVQGALPIDETLSEHAVDLKAKEISDAIAAGRSLIRKAVLEFEKERPSPSRTAEKPL